VGSVRDVIGAYQQLVEGETTTVGTPPAAEAAE
jgi:hypothetical protein